MARKRGQPVYLKEFSEYLREQERSERTIEKYTRDARRLAEFVGIGELNKPLVLHFKENLRREMSPISANSVLAAVNCFLKFLGLSELCVRAFKLQRRLFSMKNELTAEEYKRLVKAALNAQNERLALIIQAICSTGILCIFLLFVRCAPAPAGIR